MLRVSVTSFSHFLSRDLNVAIRLETGNYTDAESAEATAPLWSIYVSEADRYDKALVESWKGDMSGMLIFVRAPIIVERCLTFFQSGLYSASLTAFLIESYKTLQPDSGDATVALLTQMVSLQLAVASGITLGDLAPAASFQPTAASLVCNILWFLSLALSLTCALLATLVEQWARDFIHKTEMCPSSVRRARVFSFLYFGLKKFKMHVVVDTIPMILHASLFFFLLD